MLGNVIFKNKSVGYFEKNNSLIFTLYTVFESLLMVIGQWFISKKRNEDVIIIRRRRRTPATWK